MRKVKSNQAKIRTLISTTALRRQLRKEIKQRAQVVKELEKSELRLLESYKHLGIINRQISILVDLSKKSRHLDEAQIINSILNALSCVSKATIISLMKYDQKRSSFVSLANQRAKKNKSNCGCFALSLKEYRFLRTLLIRKSRLQKRMNGRLNLRQAGNLKLKYALFLPLLIDNQVKGLFFLGFSDRHSVSTQELDFYEAYTNLTSFITQNLGAFQLEKAPSE